MNISETSGPIAIKFYLKHHWGGEKVALGLGQDRIRTLLSMATYSSHMVIMGKTVLPLFLNGFSSDHFYTCKKKVAGNRDMHESLEEFEVWPGPTTDYGVSCP